MKHALKSTKPIIGFALLIIVICLSSWKNVAKTNNDNKRNKIQETDTSKPNKRSLGKDEYRIGDIDKDMIEVDKAIKRVNEQMKKLDFTKMDAEINIALSKIKEIDFDNINKEVEAEMKKVDWNKINEESNKAIIDATMKMKEVDTKKIKAEMAKLKDQLAEEKMKFKIDAEKIKKEVSENLNKAKDNIKKAKEKLQQIKILVDVLDKDGLIDKKKAYSIKLSKGELFINDEKQSKEVYEKYKPYFMKDEFSITSDGDKNKE